MGGQPKVIVRREIDDLPVVVSRVRLLLALQHAQPAIEALGLQRFQLGGEKGQRIGARCVSHRSPVRPALLATLNGNAWNIRTQKWSAENPGARGSSIRRASNG